MTQIVYAIYNKDICHYFSDFDFNNETIRLTEKSVEAFPHFSSEKAIENMGKLIELFPRFEGKLELRTQTLIY